MTRQVRGARSLDAFVHSDVVAARAVIKLDDIVDAHNRAIIDEIVAEMKADPLKVDGALSLFSAVRHLERIPLGTTYPDVVARVRDLTRRPEVAGRATLVVDGTAVIVPAGGTIPL